MPLTQINMCACMCMCACVCDNHLLKAVNRVKATLEPTINIARDTDESS